MALRRTVGGRGLKKSAIESLDKRRKIAAMVSRETGREETEHGQLIILQL